MKGELRTGDWIRFLRDGVPTLGVIQYITQQSGYPWQIEFWTDSGVTTAPYVFEVRRESLVTASPAETEKG